MAVKEKGEGPRSRGFAFVLDGQGGLITLVGGFGGAVHPKGPDKPGCCCCGVVLSSVACLRQEEAGFLGFGRCAPCHPGKPCDGAPTVRAVKTGSAGRGWGAGTGREPGRSCGACVALEATGAQGGERVALTGPAGLGGTVCRCQPVHVGGSQGCGHGFALNHDTWGRSLGAADARRGADANRNSPCGH